MVPVLAMLLTLFVFVEANDRLGLTPYVIDAVSPFMTAQLLPGCGIRNRVAAFVHHGIQLGCSCYHDAHCFPIGAGLRGQHSASDGGIVLR